MKVLVQLEFQLDDTITYIVYTGQPAKKEKCEAELSAFATAKATLNEAMANLSPCM